jgi:cysteinyl-tRNA synthetase
VEWADSHLIVEKHDAKVGYPWAPGDAQVEILLLKHSAARTAKDFKTSDAVRDELLAQGVILENTKDGVRWKRK